MHNPQFLANLILNSSIAAPAVNPSFPKACTQNKIWNGTQCVNTCDQNHTWDPAQQKCSNGYGYYGNSYGYVSGSSNYMGNCLAYGNNFYWTGSVCKQIISGQNYSYNGANPYGGSGYTIVDSNPNNYYYPQNYNTYQNVIFSFVIYKP